MSAIPSGSPFPSSVLSGITQTISARDFYNSGSQELVMLREVDGTTAAVSHEVFTLPVGAEIVSIYIRNKTAATFDTTSTHLALGINGDLDKYFEVAKAGIDGAGEELWLKPDTITIATAAEPLLLSATNGSAAATGDVAGTWVVMIVVRIHSKIGA